MGPGGLVLPGDFVAHSSHEALPEPHPAPGTQARRHWLCCPKPASPPSRLRPAGPGTPALRQRGRIWPAPRGRCRELPPWPHAACPRGSGWGVLMALCGVHTSGWRELGTTEKRQSHRTGPTPCDRNELKSSTRRRHPQSRGLAGPRPTAHPHLWACGVPGQGLEAPWPRADPALASCLGVRPGSCWKERGRLRPALGVSRDSRAWVCCSQKCLPSSQHYQSLRVLRPGAVCWVGASLCAPLRSTEWPGLGSPSAFTSPAPQGPAVRTCPLHG